MRRYDHIDFTPPKTVADSAKRGLEYRRRSGRGGLSTSESGKTGIGSGVQRAVNLSKRDRVSPSTVRRMRNFFNRHVKNKDVSTEYRGRPWMDRGQVAWLLWGGDPGRSWAENTVAKMDAADKKTAIRVASAFICGISD